MKIKDELWERSNGEVVWIKDLNEWHAKNALRKMVRLVNDLRKREKLLDSDLAILESAISKIQYRREYE